MTTVLAHAPQGPAPLANVEIDGTPPPAGFARAARRLRSAAPALTVLLLLASAGGCASTLTPEAVMAHATPTPFDPATEIAPATALLRSYESALNRADVDAIAPLYADDAVFMAQHRTPAVGRDAIAAAYREIFAAIRLDIAFEIDEVVVVSPTVAYARTRSAGTTTLLAEGVQVSEGNQELFVLVREDPTGPWRIGRYIFSTTQPRG